MEKTIFDFSGYKKYLHHRVGEKSERRGIKSELAKAMRCQPSYVSQVLNDNADLTLEQAEVLNRYFGHSSDEGFYFLLLVQKDRAGTHSLKLVFQAQIDGLLERRLILNQRMVLKNSLSEQDRAIYYSSWQYSAVHIALTIPELRTREELASFLRIPLNNVSGVLDFLTSVGLAKRTSRGYEHGSTHLRLGKDSPYIIQHHTHWRNQAIESLEREQLDELHYSAVVSLSSEAVVRIKNRILDEIRDNQVIIKDAKEEVLYAYCIDFFSLNRAGKGALP